MGNDRHKEPDLWSGIFLFLLGVVLCFFSWQIGLGILSKPGPGLMPFLVGLALASLSFGLILQVLWRKAGASWEIRIKWGKILCVLGIMVAYGFLMERIGLILVTFLFITCMMKYVGSLSWVKALWGGAISSLASYFLFVYLLKTQIPHSFWGWF